MMNKRFLQSAIAVAIIIILAVSGCSDLSSLATDAENAFNDDAVSSDAENLTVSSITYAPGDSAASVTADFQVPVSGDSGTTITWTSSDPAVVAIAADGSTTVSRPSGSNATVTLTATITKGDSTYTKTITVIVLAADVVNHAITFNANGGSGSMSNQTVAEGATANLNANTFTYSGHTFSGWATSSGGSVVYADGASFTMGGSDVTLYAVWSAITHTITFNANGGSGSMSNQTIEEGATASLNANTYTYSGHTFSGWATSSGGSVVYADGASFTMGGSDVTLYAVWAAITHTITFNANGGSGSMSNQTIEEGATASLTTNAFTYADHTFSGWATSSGGNVVYADGADYTMGTADAVLYAVWRADVTISSITPDGESSASSDSDIVIVFTGSLDGTTIGTVSFASPAVTYTDGDNASITFGTTNTVNDTVTVNPTENLQQTNYTSITVSGFKDSYSEDVTCTESAFYFPVRGAMDLYFPFTNGSLTDASGRGVLLVPTGGPTLTTGHDGSADGAYSFDGTNDYMQVNGDLGIDCDADFTISAWIYLTAIANYRAIVSNYHTTGANGLMFRVNSNWAGHTNALDLSEGYSNNGALSTGTWLHVVGVYTETTRTVQFYVNGVDSGSDSTGYNIVDPLLSDSRNKFAIGADYLIGGARYFPGTIDEVRFYKYALTSTEVGNLYRNEDINDNTP